MRVLYICDTPLQVFNALNLQYHNRQYEADLIVVNQFHTAMETAEKLKQIKIFSNVITIKKYGDSINGLKRKLISAYCVLAPIQYMKKALKRSTNIASKNRYDVIIAAVRTISVVAMLRLNPMAKFWLIDDGLASYRGDILTDYLTHVNSGLKVAYTLFYKKDFSRKVEVLYLNNPEMNKNHMKTEIKRLPIIDDGFLRLTNSVFEKGIKYGCKYIWFSVPLGEESITKEIKERISFWTNDVIVRMHPRDKKGYLYGNSFIIDYPKDLWEIKVLEIDIEKCVLLSLCSTAQIVPKYIYNREPTIILLYKLYGLEYDNVAQDIIDIYNDKHKVLIPETVEELDGIIKKLELVQ